MDLDEPADLGGRMRGEGNLDVQVDVTHAKNWARVRLSVSLKTRLPDDLKVVFSSTRAALAAGSRRKAQRIPATNPGDAAIAHRMGLRVTAVRMARPAPAVRHQTTNARGLNRFKASLTKFS